VLLFLPFYSLGAAIVCRRLRRRFSSNERYVGWVAAGLISVAVTLAGVQCLRLSGAVWEVVRVGNGHMATIRGASYTRWNQQYVGADLIGGVVLFWIIALICAHLVPDADHSTDVRAPVGILLR